MTRELMAPCGSWPTPITSELVVRAAASLGEVALDGDDVWWAERRPEEAGRTQLVRWQPGTGPQDVLPEGFNVRTAVHEYGGGAWWVRDGVVWFADWADQRLYRLQVGEGTDLPAADGGSGGEPRPVTPDPELPRSGRWADGDVTYRVGLVDLARADGGASSGTWMVAVREHHPAGGSPADVRNELVAFPPEGGLSPQLLHSGPDFVSNPRISPDGTRLCWLQWDHPDMPWDGTELHVAEIVWSGTGPSLGKDLHFAGHGSVLPPGGDGDRQGESVFQPRWAPDGSLWFISDRAGWWDLYRWDGASVEPMVQMQADIGVPQWVFGQSRYAFLDGGQVVLAYHRDGVDHLAVRATDGTVVDLDLPYSEYDSVQAAGSHVVFVGASATSEPVVVRVQLQSGRMSQRSAPSVEHLDVLRPARDLGLDEKWISVPEAIEFPTSGGRTAHGLFYPPTNPRVLPPEGERPPLLVLIHGGPTSAARPILKLGTQYWTSRGFAVVDVNYGGSTGYGRAYRNQLQAAWGVVDIDDCEAAARWLAAQGKVDLNRLCIRGGSAGGYTSLAALAFRDTFAAGASHYGVADLEALAEDTHKFESRYLDGLIGPYPEALDVYRERSPIHHVEGFDRPLAVFQGLEDQIVPPNQAEMIVDALRKQGVPVAYVPFEGEQHGFRDAANIRRALDGELSFYAQVFGFDLPSEEGIDPLPVENL